MKRTRFGAALVLVFGLSAVAVAVDRSDAEVKQLEANAAAKASSAALNTYNKAANPAYDAYNAATTAFAVKKAGMNQTQKDAVQAKLDDASGAMGAFQTYSNDAAGTDSAANTYYVQGIAAFNLSQWGTAYDRWEDSRFTYDISVVNYDLGTYWAGICTVHSNDAKAICDGIP